MRVLVVEADVSVRADVVDRLLYSGLEVAAFGDPQTAFLFLLGRLEQVDGVLMNADDEPQASRLLRRLEMLGVPIAVVTYSGRDPSHETEMTIAGAPEGRRTEGSVRASRSPAGPSAAHTSSWLRHPARAASPLRKRSRAPS